MEGPQQILVGALYLIVKTVTQIPFIFYQYRLLASEQVILASDIHTGVNNESMVNVYNHY